MSFPAINQNALRDFEKADVFEVFKHAGADWHAFHKAQMLLASPERCVEVHLPSYTDRMMFMGLMEDTRRPRDPNVAARLELTDHWLCQMFKAESDPFSGLVKLHPAGKEYSISTLFRDWMPRTSPNSRNFMPWRKLTEKYGASKETLNNDLNRGADWIALKVNSGDLRRV